MKIHIVDDIPCIRRAIREEIEKPWSGSSEAGAVHGPLPAIDSEWKFVWKLLESTEIEKGDIVLSDLYPASYWKSVPKPTLYAPADPLPEDPTNFYLAALDAIQRFLSEIPRLGANLCLLTYVPNFIENELKTPEAAADLRRILEEQDFRVFEKDDQTDKPENFADAVREVHRLIGVR